MQGMSVDRRVGGMWLGAVLVGAVLLMGQTRVALGAPTMACAGDCDGDGQVTVSEIVAAVSAALGAGPMSCGGMDVDGDGAVQVADLVTMVRLALDGCEEPFDYAATKTEAFGLVVTIAGQPAAGVSVTLADALVEPGEGQTIEDLITGNVYYQGMTDAAGRVTATVKIPTRFDAVDVIVNTPDAVGAYTVESLRALWGPFAPSARVTVPRGFLGDVTVDLQRVE